MAAAKRPDESRQLPVQACDAIAEALTRSHSYLYDLSDIARDAAALVCTGNESLGQIGRALFRFLSPHFGEELELTEKSSVPEMREKCKARPAGTGELGGRVAHAARMGPHALLRLGACACSTPSRPYPAPLTPFHAHPPHPRTQEWGLPGTGGKKGDVWARLAGEVGGGSDASPAAANARERVRTVHGERWRCARRGSHTRGL
jgi:hypothetical protein